MLSPSRRVHLLLMPRSSFDPPVAVVFRPHKALIQRDPAAYRRDVLHLPGPVDRWLQANLHLDSSNSDAFRGLSFDGKVTQHVQCNIHRVRIQVCTSTVLIQLHNLR